MTSTAAKLAPKVPLDQLEQQVQREPLALLALVGLQDQLVPQVLLESREMTGREAPQAQRELLDLLDQQETMGLEGLQESRVLQVSRVLLV